MNIPHKISNIIKDLIHDRADEPEDDEIRILLRKACFTLGYISVTEAKVYLREAMALADAPLKEHLNRIIQACDAEIAAEEALDIARKSSDSYSAIMQDFPRLRKPLTK